MKQYLIDRAKEIIKDEVAKQSIVYGTYSDKIVTATRMLYFELVSELIC